MNIRKIVSDTIRLVDGIGVGRDCQTLWETNLVTFLTDALEKNIWDKAFCHCGSVILADTEDCTVALCVECTIEISKAYNGK